MRELIPDVFTWSVREPDRAIDFNGWYVRKGGEAVVIDPPRCDDSVLAAIAELGAPSQILVTNANHARASEQFRQRFDCPIWVHEDDRERTSIPVQETYRDASTLACGLKAVTVADGKTPGETVFYFDGPTKGMIVGDACIGVDGELKMLPPEKFENVDAARRGLRRLLDFDFEALLLGDGTPILEGAKQKLAAFVSD